MQIPDVRTGDVVDVWFSIVGVEPLLRDMVDVTFELQWSERVEETWATLRSPEERAIESKVNRLAELIEAHETRSDGVLTRTWVARALPTFRYDGSEPPGWWGHARVLARDVQSWSGVAERFAPFYASPSALPDTLEAAVEAIGAAHEGAERRTVEALRLVQREVRYLSVYLGPGGFVPRPVDAVWDARAGDCKDVARLLVAVLGRLGIDAAPALVGVRADPDLAIEPAGIRQFDHCIVRVRVAGRTVWLDATGAEEGGDLDRLLPPLLQWALPLVPGAVPEVVCPPGDPVEILDVRETFRFGPTPDSPCELEVVSVHKGWRANHLRSGLRAHGTAVVYRNFEEFYAARYGGAVSVAPPTVVDDLDANTLTVAERYSLPHAWRKDGERVVFTNFDGDIAPELPVLPTAGRASPLHLGPLRRIHRRSEFHMPGVWACERWAKDLEAPGLQGATSLSMKGDSVMILDVGFSITARDIEPHDCDAFLQAWSRLTSDASLTHSSATVAGAFPQPSARTTAWQSSTDWPWLSRHGLVVLLVLVALAVARLVL